MKFFHYLKSKSKISKRSDRNKALVKIFKIYLDVKVIFIHGWAYSIFDSIRLYHYYLIVHHKTSVSINGEICK